MSVTYPKDATFATLPFRQFRDLLGAWVKGGTVAQAAALSKVGSDASTAAAAMDEALSQGLLDDRDDAQFSGGKGPDAPCSTIGTVAGRARDRRSTASRS